METLALTASLPGSAASAFYYNKSVEQSRGSLFEYSTDVNLIPRTMKPEQLQKFRSSNSLACTIDRGHAAKPAQDPANIRLRSSSTIPPINEGINDPVHEAVTWGLTNPSYDLPKFDPTYHPSRPEHDLRMNQQDHGGKPDVQGWTPNAAQCSALHLRMNQQDHGGTPVTVQGWTRISREGMYWDCQWKLVERGWVQRVTRRRNGYKERIRKLAGQGKGKKRNKIKMEVFPCKGVLVSPPRGLRLRLQLHGITFQIGESRERSCARSESPIDREHGPHRQRTCRSEST